MKKHSDEYYLNHNIFPPNDDEEGIMYFRRLICNCLRLTVENNSNRLFQQLSRNLSDQKIINILPNYDRRIGKYLVTWICIYHTIDHYPNFIEYFYTVHNSCLKNIYEWAIRDIFTRR